MDALSLPVSLPGGDTDAASFAPGPSLMQQAGGLVAAINPDRAVEHAVGDVAQIAFAGQAAQAAYQAGVYDGGDGQWNSNAAAIEQRIKDVKNATGQQLENPLNGGYQAEAEAALRAETPNAWLPPGDLDVQGKALDIFRDKLDALAQQNSSVQPSSTLAQSGGDIANKAVAAAQRAAQAAGPIGGTIGGFLGGAAAMARDPLQLGMMAFGGGEAKLFASVAGQILETFGRQALLNAGMAAVEEPSIQNWRAQRGQPAGVVPALKDIAEAGVFGGALGVVGHGLAHLIGHAPELGAALDSTAADHAAAGVAPAGIPADRARDMLTSAGNRMEGAPGLPEPAAAPWTPEEIPGEKAAAALGAARPATAWDAADILRGSLQLQNSALASADPQLRRLGQLADLSDRAYDLARDSVDPVYAAHVAALAPDARQAGLMRGLIRYAPQTEDEAHTLISQAMDARAVPDAVAYMLGEKPAALSQPQTLRAFLKAGGGLRDEGGDLKAMSLHRLYPGIVSKRGMGLDAARELAAEAGYLGDVPDRATGATSIADLLDALREDKVYSIYDAPAIEALAKRQGEMQYLDNVHSAGARLDYVAQRDRETIDPEWRAHASEVLARDPELDEHDALERSAIVLYNEARDHELAHADSPFPDEIDHETLDQADRETGYGGAGEGENAGGQGEAASPRGPLRDAGADGQGEGGAPSAEAGATREQQSRAGEQGQSGAGATGAGESRAGEQQSRAGEQEKPVIRAPAEMDGRGPDDLLSRFPVEANGKVEMLSRAEMGKAAARQAWLGKMIETCVL